METCRVSFAECRALDKPLALLKRRLQNSILGLRCFVSAHEAGILPSDLYLALKTSDGWRKCLIQGGREHLFQRA